MSKLLIYLITVVLWMLGGQVWKGFRRFLFPILSGIFLAQKRKSFKQLLVAIPLMLVTSVGYGVDSVIMKLFKHEWLVRLVYSSIVCLVFCIALPYNSMFDVVCRVISVTVTTVAFQLRLGGFKIGKYDFLFEDFFRASAISTFFLFA